jgi:ADP-ribosylglycohydrolase
MIGAIFGDIAGSAYEFSNTSDYNFEMLGRRARPTDDSYMTLAVARALMETEGQGDEAVKTALVRRMKEIGVTHPYGCYGGMFNRWLRSPDPKPYGSYGNGSAMRVSSAGWLYGSMEETLRAARLSACVTHDHPEGIKGAEAAAAAVFLARTGAGKADIREYIEKSFGYDLSRSLAEIKAAGYEFDETCRGTVPEALTAFLEGESYEDVIRRAVVLGGDSDTLACIAGGVAEAYYGMPEDLKEAALSRLDARLRKICEDFEEKRLPRSR